MRALIMDPAGGRCDGWHDILGTAEDALNGNVSRVFLTDVPLSIPTTDCRQPDDWSCGPYSLAECLGMSDGENARSWLLDRGWIDSQHGTWYEGIVGYISAYGYGCEYDYTGHDGEMDSNIFTQIINRLRAGKKVILCMHGIKKGCRTNYYTKSGHYICVYGIDESGIVIDGLWGPGTTTALQRIFNTTEDGIISNQNEFIKHYLPGCQTETWEFVPQSELLKGSELIKAMQRFLRITDDGFCGMETITALQEFLHVTVDGFIGGETVTALQLWINTQI